MDNLVLPECAANLRRSLQSPSPNRPLYLRLCFPQLEADRQRTEFIESQGYKVILFWNNDVIARIDGVVREIERVIADMPSPNPSRKREGG